MSASVAAAPPGPRLARPRRPRRLSPQVEAQLSRLETLGDRHALVLLLRAIEQDERAEAAA